MKEFITVFCACLVALGVDRLIDVLSDISDDAKGKSKKADDSH